ncbi:zinc transporter ZIP8-like [Arapaima gigas]
MNPFQVLVTVTFYVLTSGTSERDFMEDIIRHYVQNSSVSSSHLEHLLRFLANEKSTVHLDQNASKCLSTVNILAELGIPNHSQLSADHLLSICPILLSQARLPACPLSAPVEHKTINYEVWGYGILAVTIINLFSLLGLALIPFTKKPYFPKVLTFFIGLAIGTLFSNAALQLIPEALGFDPKADNYVLNAVGIFGGFYLLFFVEKILKLFLKTEHQHSHSQFSPPEPFSSNTLQNGDMGNNVEVIAVSSFGSDKASVTSVPLTEPEEHRSVWTCHWLKWNRLSNIKTVAWMISLSDALHNFIDGLAIGASFTVSILTGFSTSIAIVCEEFPHELGDFVILLSAGMSIPQAIFFNLLSAMSCYIGLVLGILVGSNFAPNVIFALAGGMFLYIALADMFPEMNHILVEQERTAKTELIFFLIQNVGLLTGFSVILLITIFAGNINLG